MILADQTFVITIICIALLIELAAGTFFLFRGYERLAQRTLRGQYADLAIHPDPQPGDVILTYHTYHGLVAWITQTPHRVALPPDDARTLLKRFLCFNLTWGLVTYGALLILPLAIYNYFAQRRTIARHEATAGISASLIPPTNTANHSVPGAAPPSIDEIEKAPSLFRRIVGWIAASQCVVFSISGIVGLANGEFVGAIFFAIIAIAFGSSARYWLSKHKTDTTQVTL